MLEKGIKGNYSVTVTTENTAKAAGSGTLEVFGTPYMLALMEKTCYESVAPYLEEGQGTVGTLANITHSAATPMGMTVRCESELIEVDRKRLVFEVKAYDEAGLIGEGTHERFIITEDKFLARTNAKLEK